MKIYAIEDNNSDFENIQIKSDFTNTIQTPHCKKHGAMNKVSVFDGGGYWRCISTISKKNDNNCRTGCIQRN